MNSFKIAFKLFLFFTILTGLIYPIAITGVSQLIFQNKANGSMIIKNDKLIGSELIGQQFIKPEFFWGRPSAISNNPMPSGGSNLSPVGKLFKEQFDIRVENIRKYHCSIPLERIPKDLLFASASGVDPHISPEAAYFQASRVANYRNFNKEQRKELNKLISQSIEKPDLFVLGQARINVLKLNVKLLDL
jgi:potassium-transporting ATPase KdpC subunit